jgi:hypothetical protein
MAALLLTPDFRIIGKRFANGSEYSEIFSSETLLACGGTEPHGSQKKIHFRNVSKSVDRELVCRQGNDTQAKNSGLMHLNIYSMGLFHEKKRLPVHFKYSSQF